MKSGKCKDDNSDNINRNGSIDAIRVYSLLCIILMHIYANSGMSFALFEKTNIDELWNNLTFLFMILSAYCMCEGYYSKFINGTINIVEFYNKRYKRIWPFFSVLVLLELLTEFSISNLYEAIADITLCFGFLPNASIRVIGVGWFLGVLFVFYIVFPFFCYLLRNKKTAWLTFFVSLLLNYMCSVYFFDANHMVGSFYSRTSFIYCAVYFVAGGIVYLYKDSQCFGNKSVKIIICASILFLSITYIFTPVFNGKQIMPLLCLLLFTLILVFSIMNSRVIISNKITKFMAKISLEIYLCHMVIFGILKRTNILEFITSNSVKYIFYCALTILGSVLVGVLYEYLLGLYEFWRKKRDYGE